MPSIYYDKTKTVNENFLEFYKTRKLETDIAEFVLYVDSMIQEEVKNNDGSLSENKLNELCAFYENLMSLNYLAKVDKIVKEKTGRSPLSYIIAVEYMQRNMIKQTEEVLKTYNNETRLLALKLLETVEKFKGVKHISFQYFSDPSKIYNIVITDYMPPLEEEYVSDVFLYKACKMIDESGLLCVIVSDGRTTDKIFGYIKQTNRELEVASSERLNKYTTLVLNPELANFEDMFYVKMLQPKPALLS